MGTILSSPLCSKGRTGTGSVDLYSSASFSHDNFGFALLGHRLVTVLCLSSKLPRAVNYPRNTSGTYLLAVYLPCFLIFLSEHYGRERRTWIASY
jgi:hypothetical protein